MTTRAAGLLALLTLVALCGVTTPAASANFGGIYATDEDAGTAIETISTAQNLWAYVLTDVQGGDICVVPADLENPGDGSLKCLTPAWGSSNRVVGIGSRWVLIETPYLRAGRWKLLGDGASNQSVDVFSQEFEVVPCEPGACDRTLAQETAAAYKAAAANMAISMAGMNATVALLTKINPDEPFDHFKNALNKAVKKAGESSSLYMRVIADEAERKLEPITRLPGGPHAMALALAQQISADCLEMYLDIVNDPPEDYATVAPPEFDLPALPSGDADIDGLMLDLAQLSGYGAAGLTAYERYQQAVIDDSDSGVHRQAAAMGRFDAQLTAEMWSAARGLDAWAARLESDPDFGGAMVSQEHVDALRPFLERVRVSGLTAGERQEFQDAGLNAAQIADVTGDLAALDLDAVQVDVPIQQLARSVAAELREQAPVFDAMAREAEAVAQTNDSPPVASFDATPLSGEPPLAVTFRDTSQHADDEPLQVSWDFGDGGTAAGEEVSHTFGAGTFVVTQAVSDGVSTSTATRTIVVLAPNQAPTASISRSPATGDAPLTVEFDGSGSSDADGAIMAYEWDFGDGATETGASGSYTYTAPGDYTVTLKVTDDRGASDTDTASVLVNEAPGNHAPVAVADTLGTRQGVERTVNVLANDSDPDGDALELTDSSPPAHGSVTCTAAGECTYTPAAGFAGSDGFTYVVADPSGAEATGSVAVTVSAVNQPPSADAGPDLDIAENSYAVFDARGSADQDGTIASYTWDFGDGTDPVTRNDPSANHLYGRPGTFTARLVVTDDDGAEDEDTVVVTVANNEPTTQWLPAPRAPVGTTRPYTLLVSTGPSEPTSVSVDFGDGSQPVRKDVEGVAYHVFDHAFAAPGTYTLIVTATDSVGASDSAEAQVVVADAVADAGPDRTAVEGSVVELDGASTPPDDHTTVSWDFGDGSPPGAGVDQEHTYRDEGVYTATATVRDDGGTATDAARIEVTNAAPRARISAAHGVGPGEPLSLRAEARDAGVDDVLSYTWSFGDGATGSGRAVDHRYDAAGTYEVRLRVDDGDGGEVTTTRSVVVGKAPGRQDSSGRDFWLAFPTNYIEEPALTLFIAGEKATTGTVEVPGVDFSADFTVTPGQVTSVTLPAQAQLSGSSEGPQDRGIHVYAGADVSVYGLNRIKFTTDAYLGLPTDSLGTTYRVVSYGGAGGSEAAVVATANDTLVTVTPSGALSDGRPAGTPFELRLDLGEAYQLRSGEDLTGTLITSSRPVAAFGAHKCANVPASAPYCDHLVEQLTPVDSWGRRFVTMPLATRSNGDTFRILAAEDDTEVKVNGTPRATLGAGAFHEQLIDGPATIESDKPILVAQYSNGSTFDGTVSDPFMVILPPFEQFQAAYTVSTPATGFARNFINLVVPAAAAASVRVDGVAPAAGAFKPIGGSGFVGAQVEVGLGDHRIESARPLGVTVYGFDADDSYGYSGGLAVADIATVSELRLSPDDERLDVGSEACVQATAVTDAAASVADVRVDFSAAGANAASGSALTDGGGIARFCYTGAAAGEDVVTASMGALSRTARKRWGHANRAPLAVDDRRETPADTPLAIPVSSLLANDSDPDGDAIRVAAVTGASHGTVRLEGETATFTPDSGYAGDAAFRYTLSDGRGGTAEGTVHVRVVAKPPQRGSDLVLGCSERLVVLEDVVPKGGRVQLAGVADRRFAGQTVKIAFTLTRKVIARPRVGADGSFSATAPLPPRRLRNSNLARYEARIGEHRSLKLKLARRLRITAITASGGKVTVAGQVVGPFAARRSDRVVELERRVSCTQSERVGRVTPRADGTFRLTVPVPAGAGAAVYRVRTKVRSSPGSARTINTFSLPRSVNFR